MAHATLCWISLGGRFATASALYIGLGLICVGLLPETPRVHAQSAQCDPNSVSNACPDGCFCCDDGSCVPEEE